MDDLAPVIVAEDEDLIRLALAEALEEAGYNILEAKDGVAALQLIDELEDLRGLVTDIRMGSGADGWEVARRAREKFPSLAVVYVTGDSIAEWPSNGVPQSTALQKPFASAELVTALSNLLVTQASQPPHA